MAGTSYRQKTGVEELAFGNSVNPNLASRRAPVCTPAASSRYSVESHGPDR